MLMINERRPAFRTLEGWARSVRSRPVRFMSGAVCESLEPASAIRRVSTRVVWAGCAFDIPIASAPELKATMHQTNACTMRRPRPGVLVRSAMAFLR